MAKNKVKRIKNQSYTSDEQNEIKRFIIILGVVIIAVLLAYLFTRIFVTKEEKEVEPTPTEINYNTTLIGSMLNIPLEEYYVMITDTTDVKNAYYTGLMSTYTRNEDALPIYLADLKNELNKRYLSNEANLNPKEFSDFKITGTTLVKIANGKISACYTDTTKMVELLKYVSAS